MLAPGGDFKAALKKIERMVESGDSKGLVDEFKKSVSAKREENT